MTLPEHFSMRRHHAKRGNLDSSLSYSGYKREILVELVKDKTRRLVSSSDQGDILRSLDEIGGILQRLDPPHSTNLQAIDAKAQDLGMYFVASYSDSQDFERSFSVYKVVRDLVRYVLLMDRYYEVGNLRYRAIAKALLANLRERNDVCVWYLLSYSLRRFWPFWSFEQKIKKLLYSGHKFTSAEIRHFNLLKSSDAPIIYCTVLESMLSNFNPNVALVIHYNQGLQDIDDDFDDIEEDLREQMPNVFLLGASSGQSRAYADKTKSIKIHPASIPEVTRIEEGPLTELVGQYARSIEGLEVPPQFRFLKLLARGYVEKIERKLGNRDYLSQFNLYVHS